MKRQNEQEDNQLNDKILKLWNDKQEGSQRRLLTLIGSLDETARQEVLNLLEESAGARPSKDYRSKFL